MLTNSPVASAIRSGTSRVNLRGAPERASASSNDPRTGVTVLVDAMAEARETLAERDALADDRGDVAVD